MSRTITAGRKPFAVALRTAACALLLCAALPHQAAATGSAKFIPTFAVYYGGSPTLVADDVPILAKFDLIDTDPFRYYEIGPNTWAAIKAISPNVQIYLYKMGSEAPNYLDDTPQLYLNGLGRYSVSRGHPMGSLNGDHPELFLLDSSGNRIYNVGYSNPSADQYWHLMNFGAAAYQSYWLTAVKADVVDQPWVADGVFADNCNALNWGAYSAVPAEYPDGATWTVAMNAFVEAITAGLHGVGQKLWCNRGETRTLDGSAAWRALDASANPPDVLGEEGAFAVGWGGAAVQFYQELEWKRQVDTMGAIRNSKVTMISHTKLAEGETGTDNWGKPVTFWQTLWYSLGSFLLSKNDDLGNAYFMFRGPGYSKIWWFDEYDKIDLGKATVPRVEQAAPSITYTGGWAQEGSRPWSGGTAAYSGTAGAQATFTFSGTSVSWIGFRGPQAGIARVSLDGVLVAEIDTYKTTEEVRANLFSATGLAAGNHTLTIEATGLKNAASTHTYIAVDAFDVNPNYNVTTAATANGSANVYWREFERGYVYVNPTADDMASVTLPQASRQLTHDNLSSPRDSIPSVSAISLNSHHAAILLKTVARFEQTSPSITGTAGWTLGDTSRTWSGGSAAYSTTAGTQATFGFNGTSVSWIGARGPQTGIARVSLDGALVAEVDTYQTTEEIQANVFSATDLAAGNHTLTIEVTGLKNAASTHTYIAVDAFDVTQ